MWDIKCKAQGQTPEWWPTLPCQGPQWRGQQVGQGAGNASWLSTCSIPVPLEVPTRCPLRPSLCSVHTRPSQPHSRPWVEESGSRRQTGRPCSRQSQEERCARPRSAAQGPRAAWRADGVGGATLSPEAGAPAPAHWQPPSYTRSVSPQPPPANRPQKEASPIPRDLPVTSCSDLTSRGPAGGESWRGTECVFIYAFNLSVEPAQRGDTSSLSTRGRRVDLVFSNHLPPPLPLQAPITRAYARPTCMGLCARWPQEFSHPGGGTLAE